MKDKKGLLLEFLRYVLVGGSAFVVDFAVLYLTRTYLFGSLGQEGILLATAIAFLAGLAFNYIFSILFVFKGGGEKVKGQEGKAFLIFAIIGLLGLGFTQLGMWGGTTLFGNESYLWVKAVVAILVLFWNYIARKILIFR